MTQTFIFAGGSERWHDLLGAAQAVAATLGRAGFGTQISQDYDLLDDTRTDNARAAAQVRVPAAVWQEIREAGLVAPEVPLPFVE